MTTTLNPYLSFDNTCREAMNFYKDCLGGELNLQKVSEMPEMASQMPESNKDKILHATLTSGSMMIMGSDLSQEKQVEGNTVRICVNCGSEEEIDRLFLKFSNGGKINDPLRNMPWGAKYGACTDKFGKHWIFNFQKSK